MFLGRGNRMLTLNRGIIRDSPVYPVMLDTNNTVLSVPPVINGNHSKITLDSKNVFIELTATDETKL